MLRLSAILLALVVGVCVFALPFAHSLADRQSAHAALRAAELNLREAEARRSGLADRLAALRSQSNQVEITARAEFRLTMPGERFEILGGDSSLPLLANNSRRERLP